MAILKFKRVSQLEPYCPKKGDKYNTRQTRPVRPLARACYTVKQTLISSRGATLNDALISSQGPKLEDNPASIIGNGVARRILVSQRASSSPFLRPPVSFSENHSLYGAEGVCSKERGTSETKRSQTEKVRFQAKNRPCYRGGFCRAEMTALSCDKEPLPERRASLRPCPLLVSSPVISTSV